MQSQEICDVYFFSVCKYVQPISNVVFHIHIQCCMFYKIKAALNVKVMFWHFSCCFTYKNIAEDVQVGMFGILGKIAGLRVRSMHLCESWQDQELVPFTHLNQRYNVWFISNSPVIVSLFDLKSYFQIKKVLSFLALVLFFFLHLLYTFTPSVVLMKSIVALKKVVSLLLIKLLCH